MKEKLWQHLAGFIATRPQLVDRVIAIGKRNAYSHLYHYDGSDYMGRWWLMPRWLCKLDEHGFPFPFDWLPFIVRLHHIRSEDWDRDLHDHPADYRTILLRGWYVEEDIYGKKWTHLSGSTRTARAETFHRITQVSEGGVWTIFIMRKKRNDWGFLKDGKKVPWRRYAAQQAKRWKARLQIQ
jgi:hypothetical protein